MLERLLQLWCIGGGCTPYATTPKALFLGNGETRDDASVQSAVSYNGNLHLTSKDGSEIYVFNNYVHTQTVRPMTGAVIHTFGYDGNGQLITVTDATGNVTTIQRDANENATAVVSPYGQSTTLAVDTNGYLSQVTDPAGNIVKLSSGATGLLASLTDANGNVHSFQYDTYGRLTNDAGPAGGSISTARTDNSSGYRTTKTTALGLTSSYAVTFNSTTSSSTQQFTNIWPNGLQATETDTQQLGQTSESMVLPDGTSTTATFGPDPRWGIQVPIGTSQTAKLGNLTMNTVGSRSATLGTPGNPFSLTAQTDTKTVNGRSYTSAFTASDRTYLNTSPVGRTLTVTLDSLERPASTQVGKRLPTNLTYDSRGRLAATAQGPRTTAFSYDTNGFLAGIVDPLKRTTSFTRDPAGNILTSTLPDGRVINYSYDANGNLASLTPPGKSAHAFAYTAVNLPSSYSPPTVAGTGATAYAYDADRNLTTITRPDGESLQFNYDNAGRPSSTVTPTQTIDYTYNLTTGNLASAAANGGEQIAYSYNGPLPTASAWTGTVAGSVSRRYNNNFWVTSVSISGGNSVGFQYDNDGLVTRAGPLVLRRSASDGLIAGTSLGLTTDSRGYDPFGELSNYAASYNGRPLYAVTFTRDADGRVINKSETIAGTTSTFAYAYDPVGRLAKVTKNGTSVDSYSYDTNSNRVRAVTASGTVKGAYDAQDRLLTYGSASYTYTANGELASRTIGTQSTAYTYDVLGNLTSATLPNGTKITYIVDPENQRVGKEVNGVLETGFLYDGGKIVAQLNGSNQVVSQFVYASGATSPDYMISGGVTYRIFSDHLGSPCFVVNTSSGAIVEEIAYDEFGNVLSDTNPGFQPFGFAGGLYDQDTKLVRFGARDYNPGIGRWTAKDPVLFRGGDTNLYGYVVSDPVNMIDPLGLEGVACICEEKKETGWDSLGHSILQVAAVQGAVDLAAAEVIAVGAGATIVEVPVEVLRPFGVWDGTMLDGTTVWQLVQGGLNTLWRAEYEHLFGKPCWKLKELEPDHYNRNLIGQGNPGYAEP